MTLAPNGDIFVGANDGDSIAIGRFHANGTLDTSFGDHGLAHAPANAYQYADSVAVEGDGKILLAAGGYSIYRFMPNGTLERDFGTNGEADISPPPYLGRGASRLRRLRSSDDRSPAKGWQHHRRRHVWI